MTLQGKNARKGTLARGATGVPCDVSSSRALKIERAKNEASESWRFDLRLKQHFRKRIKESLYQFSSL